MPRTFVAFVAGFAGISGFPPFGMFIGELLIVIGAFRAGRYWGVGVFILTLCVIFAGFANQALKIAYEPRDGGARIPERACMVWPQYILLITSLVLCFWIPESLYLTIVQAVAPGGGGF